MELEFFKRNVSIESISKYLQFTVNIFITHRIAQDASRLMVSTPHVC